MPTFSIIIPTYNSAKTLGAAIESIISQTFTSLEVLIMDALSKDKTADIVMAYKQKDDRIKWFSEKDNGIYDAMNKGIKKSSGEYLFFLGSDDTFYDNNILQKVHDNSAGFDIVYGNIFSNRMNGKYDGEFINDDILDKNIGHQSIFYKRNVFEITGNFNLKYRLWADWDQNMKWLSSKTIKKKYIDLIIANYGDDGLSAASEDIKFRNDQLWNYINYNKDNFTFSKRIGLVKHEISKWKRYNKKNRARRIMFFFPFRFLQWLI